MVGSSQQANKGEIAANRGVELNSDPLKMSRQTPQTPQTAKRSRGLVLQRLSSSDAIAANSNPQAL